MNITTMRFAATSRSCKTRSPVAEAAIFEDLQAGAPLSRRTLLSGLSTLALGTLLPRSILAAPTAIKGVAESPTVSARSRQVVDLLAATWNELKTSALRANDTRWFIVRPNLYAAALVGETGMMPVSIAVLHQSVLHPGVPLSVVQDTIAALGILAEKRGKDFPGLAKTIADGIRPFAEKTLVDYQSVGKPQRAWLDDSQRQDFLKIHAIESEHQGEAIRVAAQRALGKTASAEVMETFVRLFTDENAPQARKTAWMDTLSTLPLWASVPPELLSGVLADVERSDFNRIQRWSETEQRHLGQKALFLATRPLSAVLSDRLLKGIQQYFQVREKSLGGTEHPWQSDFLFLNALSHLARRLPSAQKQLLQVLSAQPKLLLYAAHHYIAGSYNTACDAGETMNHALREIPTATTRNWLLSMAKGRSVDPVMPVASSKQPAHSREVAMTMMATRPYPEYAEYFRSVLQNNQDPLQGLAMVGLANLGQAGDLPFLLDKANDVQLSEKRRLQAIQCVFKIVGKPFYPEALMQNIRRDFPLNDEFEPFWRFEEGLSDFDPEANPFQTDYEAGLESSQAKLWPELAKLGQSPAFRKQYLAPIISALSEKQVGPHLAVAMLMLLSACGETSSAPLILNMVDDPASFLNTDGLTPIQNASARAKVRPAALRALGGVSAPEDSKAALEKWQKILTRSLFGQYRTAALMGMQTLGQRAQTRLAEIDAALKNQPASEVLLQEKSAIQAGCQARVELAMTYLKNIETSAFREEQGRMDKDAMRLLTASAVIAQGAETQVLERLKTVRQLAEESERRLKQMSPGTEAATDAALDLKRYRDQAVGLAHALMAAGKCLNEPDVRYYAQRQYAGLDKVHAMGATGKGQQMLLFDGAMPYPLDIPPEIQHAVVPFENKIAYPGWMVFRPRYFDGSHWLMVMNQALLFAPGIEKVTARSWGYAQKPDPDMTPGLKDPSILMYLDALTNRIRAEDDPLRENADFANSSWGASTVRLYEPEFREGLNLIGGLHHGLSATGVTSAMSAGNGGIGRPIEDFADERANSPIGDLYDENLRHQATPGVFYFAPLDTMHEEVALRASVPNYANPADNRTIFSTPGGMETIVKVMPWTRDVALLSGSASSFAAPSGMGLLAAARQLRLESGLKPWTPAQEEAALKRASTQKSPWDLYQVNALRLMALAKTDRLQ